MKKNIAVIKGDGIGPEIVNEALKVLDAVSKKYSHTFNYEEILIGGCAIDQYGTALPDVSLNIAKQADSTLLGAVGGPKWDNPDSKVRPEQGLLAIRAGLECFANIRPAKVFPQLSDASPLKNSIIGEGFDIVIVRELTGGIYFGERGTKDNYSYDTEKYTVEEIERIAKRAFEIASSRKKILHSVDKANVLESSRLWRKTVAKVGESYPDVEIKNILVDNTAMQLVHNPSQFDVVLTNNIFGDILSDEASMITGSIGMLASASIGASQNGIYEPIHGSAPDIAGKGIANPIATILSAAMMLDISFGLKTESKDIENAVSKMLDDGYRTSDIYTEGMNLVSTSQAGEIICNNILRG